MPVPRIEFAFPADLALDERELRAALEAVFAAEGVARADISVAVVDDATIHALNRRHLNHDHPTDALSFVLSEPGEPLEGEIIVSHETARRAAAEHAWPWRHELLWYVIHAALHLCGHDDGDPESRAVMRRKELCCLAGFGLTPPLDACESGAGEDGAAENAARGAASGAPAA